MRSPVAHVMLDSDPLIFQFLRTTVDYEYKGPLGTGPISSLCPNVPYNWRKLRTFWTNGPEKIVPHKWNSLISEVYCKSIGHLSQRMWENGGRNWEEAFHFGMQSHFCFQIIEKLLPLKPAWVIKYGSPDLLHEGTHGTSRKNYWKT